MYPIRQSVVSDHSELADEATELIFGDVAVDGRGVIGWIETLPSGPICRPMRDPGQDPVSA